MKHKNHIFKKIYIKYLFSKANKTINHVEKIRIWNKAHAVEKSIGLVGWNSDPNTSWKYPHYKGTPSHEINEDDSSSIESSSEYDTNPIGSYKDSIPRPHYDNFSPVQKSKVPFDTLQTISLTEPLNGDNSSDRCINECSVCFEKFGSRVEHDKKNISIVRACIIPCGHAQTCNSCLNGLKICPICNTFIEKYIQVYI